MGRLFDAVSSLAGVCHRAGYEAQAALELEAAAVRAGPAAPGPDGYAFALRTGSVPEGPLTADPAPLLAAVAADVTAGVPPDLVAARFHRAVAVLVRQVCAARARAVRPGHGRAHAAGCSPTAFCCRPVAGGCGTDGFTVLRHRLVPPNDGGLALGQLVVAARTGRGTVP